MRAWRFTVELADVFHDEDTSTSFKARTIAERLKSLPYYCGPGRAMDPEFVDLVDQLTYVDTDAEFNDIWDELYDWGDYNKRLWLGTFG